MSESRDLAFCVKLFGKTIPVPVSDETLPTAAEELRSENLQPSANHMIIEHLDEIDGEDDQIEEDDDELHKDPLNQKKPKPEERKNQTGPEAEESTDAVICSTINENPKTPPVDKETPAAKALKVDEEQSEGNNSKEKPLKKPDKILPCPRCNSLDTKFCYYNNYNVNQPRHFCKKCQRYWTAGGTMRNVPVGAGRRKNKSSTSQYRQITVSEAIQTSQLNTPELMHRVQLKPNGTVLSFGSDAPLCESMASVLNIAEKPMQSCHNNGFIRQEEPIYPISNCGENGEENSSGSSVTASNSAEEANRANLLDPSKQNCPGFTPQIPCFPGAPWSYPWNPPQWGAAMPPPPSFCASSFPVSFYPATAYWGCTIPGAWSIPWISPPSPHTGSPSSALSSPTLGKHSREGNTLKQSDLEMDEMRKQSNPEKCLWIPKTLRIDDPGEAAKSSIWATLGIKHDKMDASSGGLFKAFESKVEESKHTAGTSQVLHANPAALSRSRNFHESS